MHSLHVNQRQKRVSRYGTGSTDLLSALDEDAGGKSYAMLSNDGMQARPGNDLRKRIMQSKVGSESATQLLQKPRKVDQHAVRRAEAVETSLAKMGKLFTEMASLVMEQGETIERIEDDVEAGLEDTKLALDSLTSTYEMTKGNRSMIVKIFVLIVVFAFIFLVWLR